MTEPRIRPSGGLLPLLALLAALGVALMAWWPIVTVAHWHDHGHRHGRSRPAPLNPAKLAVGLARHTVAWPGDTVLWLYGVQLAAYGIALEQLLGEPVAAGVLVMCSASGPAEEVGVANWSEVPATLPASPV